MLMAALTRNKWSEQVCKANNSVQSLDMSMYVTTVQSLHTGCNSFLWAVVNDYLVSDGFLLPLSMCKRGFHDLLKVRPSSLLMLCRCISSSMASVMSRFIYLVFAARSFVSCSFISWKWPMLCSATADMSVCASLMCLLCSFILMWIDQPSVLCTFCHIHMGFHKPPVFLVPRHPGWVAGSCRFSLVVGWCFWCYV